MVSKFIRSYCCCIELYKKIAIGRLLLASRNYVSRDQQMSGFIRSDYFAYSQIVASDCILKGKLGFKSEKSREYKMGNVFAGESKEMSTMPEFCVKPQFDPMEGFPNGRKPRVMIATEQEMQAAKLKLEERDYCAHHLLKLDQCRAANWPWVVKCTDIKHAWDNCEYEDYVLRMKEFERERRLRERQKRKQQATAA